MFLSVIVRGRQYAIPIRHHIRHSYAFFTIDDAGLDYTKAVAIDDPEYISAEIPWINQKEFDAIKKNEEAILRGFCKYLRIYEKAVKYKDNPHYQTILRYSSLRYFR